MHYSTIYIEETLNLIREILKGIKYLYNFCFVSRSLEILLN